jgi:hypothetical protein
MRVSMKYNEFQLHVKLISYGEVEDYTVNIVAGAIAAPILHQA